MKKTIHTKEQIDAAIAVILAECKNIGPEASFYITSRGKAFIERDFRSFSEFNDFKSALNAPPPPSAADLLRKEIAEKQAELAKLEGNR